jgi:hypothetical protein
MNRSAAPLSSNYERDTVHLPRFRFLSEGVLTAT